VQRLGSWEGVRINSGLGGLRRRVRFYMAFCANKSMVLSLLSFRFHLIERLLLCPTTARKASAGFAGYVAVPFPISWFGVPRRFDFVFLRLADRGSITESSALTPFFHSLAIYFSVAPSPAPVPIDARGSTPCGQGPTPNG